MVAKLVLLFLFGWVGIAWGQEVGKNNSIVYDSDRKSNPIFDSLNYEIRENHRVLQYHDPILYLSAFPVFRPASERRTPLEDKEGKNGYWLEGDMNYRFDLYKGAYYSPKATRPLRVTFDAGFTVRMTRDESSPLLSTNNRFGIGLDYMLSELFKSKNSSLNFWITVLAHHYSNGQSKTDFFHEDGLRNNYKNGDFSTNYIRLLWYISKRSQHNKLFSAGLGYQRDGGITSPFVIAEEMKNGHYGQNRLLLNIQALRIPGFSIDDDGNTKWLTRRTKMSFRTEMSLILDKNLVGISTTNNLYRFGVHNYFTYFPAEKGRVGLIAKHYFGRDYMNMRYDDVVNAWMVGLTIDMNRY
ncbi:hypothetical protein [Sphingobacterium siyangense]|uniref:hypothetical protein n=1 Tax=Sphingobacterium siyangense TaxID=459529 RepID=UPI003C745827